MTYTTTKRPRATPALSLRKVETSWPELFNKTPALRAHIDAALQQLDMGDYFGWETIPDNWNTVCQIVSDNGYLFELTAVAGASCAAGGPKLYALATYGWDGGGSIGLATVNLKTLSSATVYDGPGAQLVMRDNPRLPGIALHALESGKQLVMQLF